MYTIDLCILCLKKLKIFKTILSEDDNGLHIEEKLKNLCELKYIDPDISKQICLYCLDSLKHSFDFKQQCLRNIFRFNSYIQTLKNTEEPCSKLEVQLVDVCDIELNQKITKLNENNCEVLKSFKLNTDEPCKKVEVKLVDIKNLKLNQEFTALNKSSNEAIKSENLNPDEHCNNIKVQLSDLKNLELNQEIAIDGSSSEGIKSENLYVDKVIVKIEKEELIIVNDSDEVNYEIVSDIIKEELFEDINDEFDILLKLEEKSMEELPKETNTENVSTPDPSPKKSGKRIHKCSECDKTLSNIYNLKRHIRNIHTKEKLFECDSCDKKFTMKNNLIKHSRFHKKIFKCDICAKKFSRKFNLTEHERTHTGEQPYGREVCDRSSTQSGSFNKHVHIHTREDKPYKCDICDKRFVLKSYLRKHVRRHTGDRPYKCDVCGTGFIYKSELTKHAVEKPHKCDICQKCFKSKKYIKQHKLIHFNKKTSNELVIL